MKGNQTMNTERTDVAIKSPASQFVVIPEREEQFSAHSTQAHSTIADPPWLDKTLYPFQSRQIEIEGNLIHYIDEGTGTESIIFSHGLLWSHNMFNKQIDYFKKKGNYRVIAFDFRGQGQSEVTKSGYDLETLSSDAVELIKKLDLGKVHFIGLSMGGMVGMRVAARHPELLKSLILLETSAEPEPVKNVGKYKRLNMVAKYFGFRLVTKSVMKIMFGKTFLNDPARVEEKKFWIKQLQSNNRTGITRAVTGVFSRSGITTELTNISCPTMIMVGDEDMATIPTESQLIQEKIKDASLIVIPRAGHSSTIEEPDFVNKEIEKFLSNL